MRSLDALHLAAAVRFDADLLVTCDLRLSAAARDLEIPVLAPSGR